MAPVQPAVTKPQVALVVLLALCLLATNCTAARPTTAAAAPTLNSTPTPTTTHKAPSKTASSKPTSKSPQAGIEGLLAGTEAQAAKNAGIPINATYLAHHPELLNVPIGPPADLGSSKWKYPSGKQVVIKKPSLRVQGAAKKLKPIQPEAFITVQGNHFMKYCPRCVDRRFYFAGTNWYRCMQNDSYTEQQVHDMITTHWNNGANVLRVWGFMDGTAGTTTPLQDPVGIYHETAFRRFDYVLATCQQIGMRLIISLVNYWTDFGGIPWYVQQVLGSGANPQAFYTNPACRQAYKNYVMTVINRINTITGVAYKNDPTILAWELCNECHTQDGYEQNQGGVPGEMVYNWQVEMSGFIKNQLGAKQLVTNGNEGYRAKGKYDPNADVSYPFSTWLNSGIKGEDFVRNAGIPTLDFMTVHIYPDHWGIPASNMDWVNDHYIKDRATAAYALNKPIVLEEYGAARSYVVPRDTAFASWLGAANAMDYGGSLVWEVWALTQMDDSDIDFTYGQAGTASTINQNQYMFGLRQTKLYPAGTTAPPTASVPGPTLAPSPVPLPATPTPIAATPAPVASTPAPVAATPAPVAATSAPVACICSDVQPDQWSCQQQAGWGKCCAPWMLSGNFCQTTCGRCACAGGTSTCPQAG